jgi:antitoxin FitA
MPDIHIEVPDDVFDALERRAGVARQTVQDYVRDRLIERALVPEADSLDDVFARVGTHSGGRMPFSQAVEAVRAARRLGVAPQRHAV